jgi:DNA-binding NarL/FixJ family response regulator
VRIAADPITERLSQTQREVLLLVCEGLSNPEIAASRNRSKTIRNMVSELLDAFAVKNRSELVVECVRRGLDIPAPRKTPVSSA